MAQLGDHVAADARARSTSPVLRRGRIETGWRPGPGDGNCDFPGDGDVRVVVERAPDEPYAIRLRVPAWARSVTASVNGRPVEGAEDGWLTVESASIGERRTPHGCDASITAAANVDNIYSAADAEVWPPVVARPVIADPPPLDAPANSVAVFDSVVYPRGVVEQVDFDLGARKLPGPHDSGPPEGVDLRARVEERPGDPIPLPRAPRRAVGLAAGKSSRRFSLRAETFLLDAPGLRLEFFPFPRGPDGSRLQTCERGRPAGLAGSRCDRAGAARHDDGGTPIGVEAA